MSTIVGSIRDEFVRYKSLAEAAIRQLEDADLSAPGPNGGNSVAIICWHISGNLRSRFTDFLTADGEKPWRKRDEEFDERQVTRTDLLTKWDSGWAVLLTTLDALTDEHLTVSVTLRRQQLLVYEALHRAMAHVAYHVGQIVYVSKTFRGQRWEYLSIPPGQSDAYNRNPTGERPEAHAAKLDNVKSS